MDMGERFVWAFEAGSSHLAGSSRVLVPKGWSRRRGHGPLTLQTPGSIMSEEVGGDPEQDPVMQALDFPGDSDGQEPTCNVGT